MASQEDSPLPCGVVVDTKGKPKKIRRKTKSVHRLKLVFRQKCPEASEIQKLHPAIQSVFVPRRPTSARYCILKLSSAMACKEVRLALHGKHTEPYLGILKCTSTTSKTLSKSTGLPKKMLKNILLTRPEVKLFKMKSQENREVTEDVKCNSSARELFIRYGVKCDEVNNRKPQREILDKHNSSKKIYKCSNELGN